MANIQRIDGKKGISYKLTAFCGYDSHGKQIRKTKTWKPAPGMTAKQSEKEAAFQAEMFEDMLNKGIAAFDGKVRFEEYAAVWMDNAQLAYKTRQRYVELLRRINAAIGHMRIENIQAHHLEAFYRNLGEDGIKEKGRFAIMNGLDNLMDEKKLSREKLSRLASVAPSTVGAARSGKRVSIESAEKIAAALGVPLNKVFSLVESAGGLSDKTILHHHRLISAILGKAKKERLIPFNIATEHATAPKVRRKEARYLDDGEARRLVDLLLHEDDIRVKTAILLSLYSGVRRGELCGLSWGDIDNANGVIHVLKASQYQKGVGIVEVDTKNESSKRPIKLPPFIFSLLAEYRKWWTEQRFKNGNRWRGQAERLFIQEDGAPIHPDTINYWLNKFIERNGLSHFSPHSLRHTFATLQIMAGVNVRTLQARTGHAQASTLTMPTH